MRTQSLYSVTQTIPEKLNVKLMPDPPHPLEQLSIEEISSARDIILRTHSTNTSIHFRSITLEEPSKDCLVQFLAAEHNGLLNSTTERPPRLARVLYDAISADKSFDFCDSVVNVVTRHTVSSEKVDKKFHAPMTIDEAVLFEEVAATSPLFQEALAGLNLPPNVQIVIDPWMYGGWEEPDEISPYYMQGFVYARDPKTNHPESNHYAFPVPLIPVMDVVRKEIVRVDRLSTGGKEDGHARGTGPREALAHCRANEFIPELVESGSKLDLKPLNVVQPKGPSFTVTRNSLVEWGKWRFRVGFNRREGGTLHDIWFDGRSVLHRLSISEMAVAYGDPRAPYHRKCAFDLGDCGAGLAANSLEVGCDCLGLIKYFDAVMNDPSGKGVVTKNVLCMHEIDDGILWKHMNYRTGRSVVTRNRKLVIQFVCTLANYDYIIAYHLDLAGAITVETRATGIVSTVPIDPHKTSTWGNVVSPGVLAQNHQHLFCVRMDPAIDGHCNTVIQEESVALPRCAKVNPYGNAYEVQQTVLKKSCGVDAAPQNGRVFKIVNQKIRNEISGRPVGYKLVPSPSQLSVAHPDNSIMARRMMYAQHHVWVTRYRDGEYWAAGKFTNQCSVETGGVKDMADRRDNVEDEDIVIWHTFALTHNPRVEDFPIMPSEIHQFHIKPADFFTRNPAVDVPSTKNLTSQTTTATAPRTLPKTYSALNAYNVGPSGDSFSRRLDAAEQKTRPIMEDEDINQQGARGCCGSSIVGT